MFRKSLSLRLLKKKHGRRRGKWSQKRTRKRRKKSTLLRYLGSIVMFRFKAMTAAAYSLFLTYEPKIKFNIKFN